jgi:hypothetical protein
VPLPARCRRVQRVRERTYVPLLLAAGNVLCTFTFCPKSNEGLNNDVTCTPSELNAGNPIIPVSAEISGTKSSRDLPFGQMTNVPDALSIVQLCRHARHISGFAP